MTKKVRVNLRELKAVPGTVFTYKGNQYVAKEDPILDFACNRCAFKNVNCTSIRIQGQIPSCKDTSVHFVRVKKEGSNCKKDQKA